MAIRFARSDDLPRLQEIEDAGDRQFDDVGIPVAAMAGSRSPSEYASYLPDRVFVAADDTDRPLGFALLDVVDGCAHLEQLAVAPACQRRGIGRALIAAAAAWARERSLPALTLCTYRDVPWNGPYYRRVGFRALDADELTPGLVRLRHHDTALGLDVAPRICMRLELPTVE
jgi:GNAT superfamily N-acetyltransferase